MLYKKLKAVLVPAILLLLLSAASVLFINALIQRPSIQHYFLGHLSEFAGYDLSTDKIKISFWHGVTLSADNLEAISKTGPEKIVASRIKVTLDAGELIKRRIVPTRIFLVRPHIELSLPKDRHPSEAGLDSTLRKILVQKFMGLALLSLEDAKVRIDGLPFKLDKLHLDVSKRVGNPRQLNVNLLGGFVFKDVEVPFTLRGTIDHDRNRHVDPSAKMTLKASMIPLTWIPWPDFLPVKGGVAEAAITFNGTLDGRLSAEGKIIADDFGLSLVRTGGTKSFDLPRLVFDFSSTFSDNILEIPYLHMSTPDFLLKVESKLDFKNKSNPHLDLNVNSPFMSVQTFKKIFPNPLVASWIENRLFPILTGGSVSVDLFSLKGTFNQIDKLKQPQNATVLSLKINWKDLEVFRDSGGLPFEEVSGKLEIENGALTVSDVTGKFGVSTIREGALHIKNIYGHDIKYNILIDGLFDFEDLSRQRAIELIPLDVRHELQKYEDPSGNLEARVNLRFEKGWNYPKIQKGEFLLKECMFVHKALFFPLELEEVQIKINEKGTANFLGTGAWGNSTFKTEGLLENSLQTGSAWIVAQGDVNQMINQFYHGKLLPLKFTERTTLKFSLFRLYDLWSCQGEIDLEGIEVETMSFSMNPPGKKDKIIFSLDLQPRKRVDLRNFICLVGDSIVELSGSYNLKDRDSFVVQVSTSGLDMEDLGMRLKDKDKETESRAQGQVLCEADVIGSFMDPLKTHVNGEVEARNLSFVSGALPSPISDCNFKIILSEKTVSILSMKMRVGESPMVVQGNLGGWDGLKGRLIVNSDYLNISDLITKDTGTRLTYKDPTPSRFTRESSVRFKLKALKGRWKKISCGPLEAECTYQSGNLFISSSAFQMEHGDLNVKGHIKGGKEPEKLFSIYVNLTDQPVKELLYSIGLEEVDLEGRLTSEAVLFTRGKDNKEMISGLTGSGNILIEDGQVKRSMVILQILDFLSLQKIFKKRPPDLSKEGFYFENIKGHFAVNNGIIDTDNLTMRSPVLNAIAKGSTDLNTKLVDYDLAAHPLGTIDSLVSKIPVAGYILTGKDKAILVYYFKVSGALGKPEVKYVPLKNLGNSLFGFFKRLFFTPGRIFEKISRTGQEPEKNLPPAKE